MMIFFVILTLFKLLSSRLIRTKILALMCTQVLQEIKKQYNSTESYSFQSRRNGTDLKFSL